MITVVQENLEFVAVEPDLEIDLLTDFTVG